MLAGKAKSQKDRAKALPEVTVGANSTLYFGAFEPFLIFVILSYHCFAGWALNQDRLQTSKLAVALEEARWNWYSRVRKL